MMHKACNGKEEVPYCFSRSSIKFQGHTALKIVEFDPNWPFPDCNSSLNSPMAMKWCTELEVAWETCGLRQPIVVLPQSPVAWQSLSCQEIPLPDRLFLHRWPLGWAVQGCHLWGTWGHSKGRDVVLLSGPAEPCLSQAQDNLWSAAHPVSTPEGHSWVSSQWALAVASLQMAIRRAEAPAVNLQRNGMINCNHAYFFIFGQNCQDTDKGNFMFLKIGCYCPYRIYINLFPFHSLTHGRFKSIVAR